MGTITDIVKEGYEESETLEIKSEINGEGDKIGKTVCALANTKGGFFVFGVDRKKTKLEEILVGLTDLDQLKRTIVDQIQLLKPTLPLKCINFRKSNISIHENKVIVVLKIIPSPLIPHQFQDKFYKRISDGNTTMDIDEIINAIIESKKSKYQLNLLKLELGHISNIVKRMSSFLKEGHTESMVNYISLITIDSCKYFEFNYADLYQFGVGHNLGRIREAINKLRNVIPQAFTLLEAYDEEKLKNFLKETKEKNLNEFFTNLTEPVLNLISKSIESLAQLLEIKIPETTTIEEVMKEFDSSLDKTK